MKFIEILSTDSPKQQNAIYSREERVCNMNRMKKKIV